jgi:AcrR family transcriptional regulator
MDEKETTLAPLSGRRAEATRNDQRILDAAREVFVADPGAPIAAVAKRAGVGIGALYRRYASKEELLQRLAAEGLQQYIAAVEDALAQDDGDPWSAFSEFMRRIVDTDTHSLTLSLAGTFSPTEKLNREAARAQELNVRLFPHRGNNGREPRRLPTGNPTGGGVDDHSSYLLLCVVLRCEPALL